MTMIVIKQELKQENAEISLIKEWLPKIGEKNRAFIKGASKALLYVQENQQIPSDFDKNEVPIPDYS